MRHSLAIIIAIMVLPAVALSQQPQTGSQKLIELPDKFLTHISRQSQAVQDKLERQTTRYLQKMVRQEQKLRRRLAKKDSAAAAALFGGAAINYQQLNQLTENIKRRPPYIPFIDTLGTSLKFLQRNPHLLANVNGLKEKLQAGTVSITALEDRLQQAETIKRILQQRQQYLQQQLQHFGFTKALQKFNRQVYYYGQQVNEYKSLLKQPSKIERKAIDLLSHTPLFQDFMRRNSQLASLFRLPGNDDNSLPGIAYASLQTREQVSSMLQQHLAAGGPAAQLQFQQQIQAAQAQLTRLKDKLLSGGTAGVTGQEGGMPGFRPNLQKTKTFRQRLEFGTNFQSQRATNYFPVTSDIGLSAGYKLNDRSVIGIGASYKIGWGQGWNRISVSRQGAGIRSFVDWKMKGSFWLSGGFEYNYRPLLLKQSVTPRAGVPEPPQGAVWQQSGLIGISKKYQVSKKFKGNVQLLWDILSYQQTPRAQPLVFRAGYDLK